MRISNPRVILLENIRQSCIYSTNTKDIKPYWDYMENFSETCADLNNPMFTEECANGIIDYLRLDKETINKCIKREIESNYHLTRLWNIRR
jgi:hypothetical protein